MSLVMDSGLKSWAGEEQERAWQEAHHPAQTPTEPQVDAVTSGGIPSGSSEKEVTLL